MSEDESFDMTDDVPTTVKVQVPDGKAIEVPAFHSKALSAAVCKNPNFKGPFELTGGTYEALWFAVQWYNQSEKRRAEWQSRILESWGKQKCKLIIDVLEVSHRLGMQKIFHAFALIFGQVFREVLASVGLKWPLPVENLEEVAGILYQAFFMEKRRSFTNEESQELDLFFAGQLLNCSFADGTHSIAPSKLRQNQVNDEMDLNQRMEQLDPFQDPVWEPDEISTVCPDCGNTYSKASWNILYYVGQSHCRVCGKKKCAECVKYRVERTAAKLARDTDGRLCPACRACSESVERLTHYAFLSQAFALSGLNVLEIAMLQLVCETWRNAATLCLRYYRLVFYGPLSTADPKDVFRKEMPVKKMILSSASLFIGHCPAVLAVFCATDWTNEAEAAAAADVLQKTVELRDSGKAPPFSHWHLLCTRTCCMPIYEYFGVQLLQTLQRVSPVSKVIEKIITQCRQTASSLVLQGSPCFMSSIIPLLLDLFHDAVRSDIRVLLKQVIEGNKYLAMQLYRELCARNLNASKNLKPAFDMIKSDIEGGKEFSSDELHCVSAFIDILEDLKCVEVAVVRRMLWNRIKESVLSLNPCSPTNQSSTVMSGPLPGRINIQPMPFLFDPSITIVAIQLDKVEVKDSQQMPLLVPLISEKKNVETGEMEVNEHPILFKKEDLRKDYVVGNCIMVLEQLLVEKGCISVPIPKYKVLPTGPDSGIIEIVKGAQSVESLRACHADKPVESYLHSLNQQDPMLRKHFSVSASFYTFLTYVLGIGDRHRGNVMVCENGAILHIDYGFIINSKPHMIEQMTAKYVRFDTDLESCVRSFFPEKDINKRLDCFFENSADLLIAVRPHADILHLLLHHLVVHDAVSISAQTLAEFITGRLLIGRRDSEAREEFVKRVKESMGDPKFQDTVHYAAQVMKKKGLIGMLWDTFLGQ